MKNTTIVIGTSAPLPPELIQRFGFVTVDFKIDWPEQNEIPGNTLFEKMSEAKKRGIKTTPKTSQPSMGVFKKAFEDALSQTPFVIAITISSGISGTYNSALQAKKMFDEPTQNKIFVIDTYNADGAESLLAIRAAEMDEQGFKAEEIAKKIEALKPQTHLFGMIESPFWLEMGGRINHSIAILLEQMQKIGMRPILSMVDGKIKPINLKMQAKDTAEALFKQLGASIKETLRNNGKIRVGISHFGNPVEAEKLKDLIEQICPQIKIDFVTTMGPVVGSHTGPGTLICCYTDNQAN